MPVVNYLWNPINDNIVREFDDEGNTIADYTTESGLHGNLISQRRDGQDRVHHSDGQGSTLALTNAAGDVTDTYAYNAFGEVTARTGSTVNPFQFIGQKGYYRDEESGDYDVRRRPLSCIWGRWLSVDVILADLNGYRVSKGNPVFFIDPSGLDCDAPTCCSCAEKIEFSKLDDLKPGSNVSTCVGVPGKRVADGSYGNEFLLAVRVLKKKSDEDMPLVPNWWEQMSDKFMTPKGRVIYEACDKPVNAFDIEGSQHLEPYRVWINDEAGVKCPGEGTAFLRDCPVFPLKKAGDQRLLCIKAEILSTCKDCKKSKLTYYVKQECFIDKDMRPQCKLSDGTRAIAS